MKLTLTVTVALVLTVVTASDGLAQRSLRPCVLPFRSREPVLQPVDEGPRRRDFVVFRERLLEATARRDAAALLTSLDPGVRVDFGGGGGIDTFVATYLERGVESPFWRDFETVLRAGGTFSERDSFAAPYVYSAWPDDLDSFECLAVTGSRVRVRRAPSLQSPVLARLDYAIVQRITNGRDNAEGWQRIGLADGRAGYIAERYTRSPIDYRALFRFEAGRWRVVAYVAGD